MKGLAVTLTSVFMVALFVPCVFAGSVYDTGSSPPSLTTYRVAKEVIEGGTSTNPVTVDIGSKMTGISYKPTDIPLGTLANPTVTYELSVGKWTVTGTPQLCKGTTLIATYQTGDGTNKLVFGSAVGSVDNGNEYVIKKKGANNCDTPLAPGDLQISIPPGTDSITLTVKTGAAATQVVHDTATGKLIEGKYQFSATVTKQANALIDYETGFKKLYDPDVTAPSTDSDEIDINIASASLDWTVDKTTGDNKGKVVVSLKATDISGISKVQFDGTDCTPDEPNKKCVCTISSDNLPGVGKKTLTIKVDTTTVLTERSFALDVDIDFDSPKAKDRTLLSGADAGKWAYRGTSVYVPLIGVNSATGRETYIKLQSKDKTPAANLVRAIILASDGSLVTADMGQITAGTPLTITGSQLKDKVVAAGKTVGDSFAAILIVTTDQANLFGYANIIDPNGAKRVPLKISGGTIVE
ncbi:MAG: hypothetical protein QW212_01530 [Nitrososphaerales archaeon]